METPLNKFLSMNGDSYFHIGHASGLLRINDKLILFDPFWDAKPFSEYWKLAPRQISCWEVLPKVDAIFVSHIHDDHYTEDIIRDSDCTVYIMAGRRDLKDKLNSYRKDCVHEVQMESPYVVLDGVRCYFVPHAFNPVDSSVFVWSSDFCFYHGNDNFVDIEVLEKAVDAIPCRIKIAAIPYAYLNWYPECIMTLTPEQKKAENERLTQKLITHAAMLISVINPERVVPAAANLFYADDLDSPFNDQGMTPWEFAESVPYKNVVPLGPGDFISGNDIFRTWDKKSFKEEIRNILKMNEPKGLHEVVSFREHHLERLQFKMAACNIQIPNHEIWFPIDNTDSLVIDAQTHKVEIRSSKIFRTDATVIWIETHQLAQWLEGEITFEMVVATRRFKMLRVPEVYNVKVLELMLNYL